MIRSKLESLSIVSVLCLVVVAPALTVVSAPAAAATTSDTADTFVVEQGGECIQLEPHGDGTETVESFYDYRNPNTDPPGYMWSSYGTTDIQENQVSKLFVYNGSEGMSLVFLHDKMGEGESHGSTVTMDISHLPDGSWAVHDDQYQNDTQDDDWDTTSSSASIDWMWAENRSDGGAYRGLRTMTADDAIAVDPGFNEEAENWNAWPWSGGSNNRTTSWVARSGDGTETELAMSESITIKRGICGEDETAPTANADASPAAVAPGEDVTFDASASGDNVGIASYEWDFDGDGSVDASGETVAHSYEANGSHNATLIVTDDAGNQDTDTATVTVEANDTDATPTAVLDAPASASLDSTVTFDASGSTDDEGVVEYRWTVDGSSVDADGATLERSFAETGNHTVAVTVVDGSGQTNDTAATVTVSDETSPTAEASAEPTTVTAGETVQFDGSASTDNDGVVSHVWAFGDGNATDGAQVTHAYEQPGTYEVTLNVTDDAGNQDRDTVAVTVEANDTDAPPTARLSARASVSVGETVQFDASDSSDDDGITEYRWDVDGDGSVDTTTDDPTLERNFSETGDHAVAVTVVDTSNQTANTTATVTVSDDSPPTARASADPTTITAGESVTFDGSQSNDSQGITSYSWDFGDGATSDGATATHTYATAGTYEATLTVTDDAGNQDTATVTITAESGGDSGGGDGGSDDGGSDDSDDSGNSDNDDGGPIGGGSSGSTGGAVPPEEETSATASRSDDGKLLVTVENAVGGEAVSADVPAGENGTGLRAVELVPASDDDRLNVTLAPRTDVDAPSGTDAGLYELTNANGTAVETVTYEFAVDRSDLGEAGALRVLAGNGSSASAVDHAVVENGSTTVVEVTTGADRVVLATVAPDVAASSITTDGTATAGRPVTVETTLTNDGHADANRTVSLTVDDAVVDSKTVTVPANGTATVSFETTFDEAGDRRVSVAGAERTISVAAQNGTADTERAAGTATDASDSSTATEVTDDPSDSRDTELAVAGFGVLVIGAAALIRVL